MDKQSILKLISTDFYQIKAKSVDGQIPNTPYILIDQTDVIIIGLFVDQPIKLVIKAIKSILPENYKIQVIVPSNQGINTEFWNALLSLQEKINVWSEWRSFNTLKQSGITGKIIKISSKRYSLELTSKRVLRFIKFSFLPSASSFAIWDELSQTIIFSHLYSMIYQEQNLSKEDIIEAVQQYHETYLPSSDFVKVATKTALRLPIKTILTLHGTIHQDTIVYEVLANSLTHEFYNTDFIVRDIPRVYRTFDYIHILNQYLQRLWNVYDKEKIISCFKESSIDLNRENLTIHNTTLKRRILYDYFFDIISKNQGIDWLNLLEPAVLRIANVYRIPKPEVYKRNRLNLEDKVRELDAQRVNLLEHNERLQSSLFETEKQLLHCPLTGEYNQHFLEQFLHHHCSEDDSIILIEIRNLNDINRNFGENFGNEAIQRLHYLIKENIPDTASVFRSNGAGFFVLLHQTENDESLQLAIKIKAQASTTGIFLDEITLAIGLLPAEETLSFVSNDCSFIINEVYKRCRESHHTNQLVSTPVSSNRIYDHAILLVDDDTYNIGVIRRICEREEIHFYQCNDVYSAIEQIKSAQIDLIISEVNLSKLDAFALKIELNQYSKFATIPFIILSHNKTKETIIRANSVNIDYIIGKPFYPEELIGLLERMFKK